MKPKKMGKLKNEKKMKKRKVRLCLIKIDTDDRQTAGNGKRENMKVASRPLNSIINFLSSRSGSKKSSPGTLNVEISVFKASNLPDKSLVNGIYDRPREVC